MFNSFFLRQFTLLLAIGLLQSCISMTVNTAEQMQGIWQSKVGGFPIVVEYNDTTVKIGDNKPVLYQLDGDQLTFADGGTQLIVISFTGNDEMTQINQLTGTSQVFTRISP